MYYCRKCCVLFEGEELCPFCGNESFGGPGSEDPCVLTEKDGLWGDVLADVLEQNRVPYRCHPVVGAARTCMNPLWERWRFFVPYAWLERARELADGLFTPVEAE